MDLAFSLLVDNSMPYVTLTSRVADLARNGVYATNFDMVLVSIYLDVNIKSFSNIATGIDVFNTKEFISKHMPKFMLTNVSTIHLYHHTFMRPLSPVSPAVLVRLNHFATLHLIPFMAGDSLLDHKISPVVEQATTIDLSAEPVAGLLKKVTKQTLDLSAEPVVELVKKVPKQTDLMAWCKKPVSRGAKRKGLTTKAEVGKAMKAPKTRTLTQEKRDKQMKDVAVMKAFSKSVAINESAAATMDKLRAVELQRRKEEVLADLVEKVVQQNEENVAGAALCKISVPSGCAKELNWTMRQRMVGFHMHHYLGAGSFKMFNAVFGNARMALEGGCLQVVRCCKAAHKEGHYGDCAQAAPLHVQARSG